MSDVEFAPSGPGRLSVVIVTFGEDGSPGIRGSLEALAQATPPGYEVIVVDNPHPSLPRPVVADAPGVTVIRNASNTGFAAAADLGAEHSARDILCFLNPDTEVQRGWLPPLLEALEQPEVGAAVPLLLGWDGRIQDAGAVLAGDGATVAWGAGGDPDDERYAFPRRVAYGSGACFLIRRDTFMAAGGFPAIYAPAYCEDVDLGRTLAARGLATVIEPASRVRHRSAAADDRAGVDTMVRTSTTTLRRRWWPDLAHRPSLSGWQQRPHRLIVARDADVHGRILIAISSLPTPGAREEARLLDLPARWPAARITLATMDLTGDARTYLHAGIEVVRRPESGWFDERRFHYDLVAVDASMNATTAPELDRTQPLATVIGFEELIADPIGVAAGAGIAP